MHIKKKISFDFDGTLNNDDVQNFVLDIIDKYDVYIITSRVSNNEFAKNWNNDLFLTADYLGIKKENIIFLELSDKYDFFKDNEDFIYHLDDMEDEIKNINLNKNVKGIL